LDSYIEKYERKYLTILLGVELYDLFIDEINVNNPPTDPIFEAIYNYIAFDNGFEIVISNGIKEMLLGFIYFHFVYDNQQYQSPIGIVQQSGENGTVMNITGLSVTRFNESVDSFRAIQSYIRFHSEDYISFNGQYLGYEFIL